MNNKYISHTEIVQEHIHLIDLEAHGLVSGNVSKVWLICVVVDNLGSHWLGGFSTNFSCNSYYICRYCLVRNGMQSQFSADCWIAYPWQLCFCEWFMHFCTRCCVAVCLQFFKILSCIHAWFAAVPWSWFVWRNCAVWFGTYS